MWGGALGLTDAAFGVGGGAVLGGALGTVGATLGSAALAAAWRAVLEVLEAHEVLDGPTLE